MIINHCRLVPELSGGIKTRDGAVCIEDGKIAAVYAEALPEGDFDASGKTLIPGMLDIHTHVTGLSDQDYHDIGNVVRDAQLYLQYGFTTIRDCGSMERAANEVRGLINSGKAFGPDIISCGLIVTPTETSCRDALMPMYSEGDGPYELRKAARREIAEHGDFIKIMTSGSAFHPQGVPKQPIMMEDELESIVRVAEMKQTYVAAHAHADSAIRMSIQMGVRTIEHATYMSEETLEILLKTKNCYLVPTLAAMFVSGPDPTGFWHERLGAMLTSCCENLKKAYLAGCKLGFGTDSFAGMTQYKEGIEFRYRHENCGMAPLDILLQATAYSAEIIGWQDKVGAIETGKQADLVLVNGRPDEDITVMYHRPDTVWKKGVRV